jgi:hypothetical protein
MTDQEKVVLVGLVLGFALSTVGLALVLGAGWAAVWSGLLLIAGALKLDAG